MPDFGPLLPDLVAYGHDGLTIAQNVYAAPQGYKPIKDVSAVTTAIPNAWKGGGSFIGLDGTTTTLAGTNAGLYNYSSSWTLAYSGTYSGKWAFAQFGGIVIGVNGAAPVKYTIATSVGAALGGTPPSATMIAIVRDFVFLAGNSSANNTVYWSSINAPEAWTIGTNQCDSQALPDGGPITGLAGGEFGLVFQETAIHRFSYVGTPVIYQRDKISDGIGCITPGAIATAGRLTFFLSNRGFYVVSDGGLQAIGDQKVDATFWQTYSRSDVQTYIRATVDPKRTLAIWSMPDKLWIYNWTLDRWTTAYIAGLQGISVGINAGVSLDALDAIYPSGLDSIPYSLDAPIFMGGEPLLTLVKSDNIIYSLGSANNMAATFQLPIREMIHGRNTRVRRARVYGDATSGVTLTVNYTGRLGDTPNTITANTITSTGYMPIRLTEQFMQPQIDIASGTTWSYMLGLQFDIAPGGTF